MCGGKGEGILWKDRRNRKMCSKESAMKLQGGYVIIQIRNDLGIQSPFSDVN